MQVKIRLQKAGKVATGAYNYRIVAISSSTARDGKHLEILGHYDPAKKPADLKIDVAKVNQWIQKGATLSDTVKSLVKKVTKEQS
ncbi:MAG: 30S ribosomal protein S16 [Candidatus Omnitrophica bacterium]|nr:30S ribosomal protein S16 [Candidatus Omnitrophota bacterium]